MSGLVVLWIYLAGMVDNLQGFLIAVSITSVMGAVISLVTMIEKYHITNCVKYAKRFAGACIISAFLAVLVPSEKTMYWMAGAYLGSEALQSDLAKDVYEIIELKVQEYKEDVQTGIEKDVKKESK